MITPPVRPKAFAVWFQDLERWSVGSFIEIGWRWPSDVIHPLADALERQSVAVDRETTEAGALRLVTLHFNGEMEPRQQRGAKPMKGRLWWANPGDVIYSKIDVRNGSIGIVPKALGRVCVTSEYPVYSVDPAVAEARYIKLLFRTGVFRRKINSMISGASGRKRVQPTDLELLEVPLPKLPIQREIVSVWEQAQPEIADTRRRIAELEDKNEAEFLAELGLAKPAAAELPKCFAVQWIDFRRWSVSYNQRSQAEADLTKGTYPVVALGTCLEVLQYGTSEKANRDGRGTPILRIKNIKGGKVETGDLKHIELFDSARAALLLNDGDILIIRTSGSRKLVGTCAVFHDDGEFVFASYLIRLRPELGRALADYLAFFINCSLGQAQVDAVSRQIMQNNINTEEIRALEIPLPALPIQRRMVKKINAGREKIAALKAEADRIASQAKADVEAMILGEKKVQGS